MSKFPFDEKPAPGPAGVTSPVTTTPTADAKPVVPKPTQIGTVVTPTQTAADDTLPGLEVSPALAFLEGITALAEATGVQGGVELPFPVAYFFVHNGSKAQRPMVEAKLAPEVAYFGGWAVDASSFLDVCRATGRPLPTQFGKPHPLEVKGSTKPLSVFMSRYLMVAPFGIRQSWTSKTANTRLPEYEKGSSRHVQMLCLLAVKEADQLIPFGPVCLTGKGYQAGNMLAGINEWSKVASGVAEQSIRSNVFPMWSSGYQAAQADVQRTNVVKSFVRSCWIPLGTFGPERVEFMAGNDPDKQSAITPIRAWTPKETQQEVTLDYLKEMYIGDTLVHEQFRLAKLIKDWLNAWREPIEAGPGRGRDAVVGTPGRAATPGGTSTMTVGDFLKEG